MRAPVAQVPKNVRLPVELPAIDPMRTRPWIDAPTFIALKPNGELSAGKLSPGLRANGGSAIQVAQIGDTLDKLLGEGTADGGLGASTHGRLAADTDHAHTVLLADARAPSKDVITVLQRASPRAIAIAVQGERPARTAYLFEPATIQAAPIHIDVSVHGLTLYGASVAWGDIDAEVQKLVESQRKATSMNLLAALTLQPQVDVQMLVTLLGALASAGVDEVQLTVDTTAPEQRVGTAGSYTGGVPTLSIGQPSASGDLDKAIIRRYIKRNIQKIQYCYEKQLLATPGLQGTVAASFTITASGSVREAQGSGVHPSVSACVASVIGSIEFPKPKDGGVVRVNYPFTFRRSGG
ncbi:MAG: AgmX/PglI C-terminal domain-containing protein [Deltaproteobacteria bacterium]|nr:AgmX/PglI C-terminal domain-containing protein [Deltaproteobacteria bacterium]